MGSISDMRVPVQERGKILGDRGSNVRRIVEVLRQTLDHNADEHGRPPFVHFKDNNGMIIFEVELYDPFDNQESFDKVSVAFRDVIGDIRKNPVAPGSRHCLRPPRVQPDDWDCPNLACGNLCFARRNSCPLCGAQKPSLMERAPPTLGSDIPDDIADPNMSRPPKHQVRLVSTAERLGPPTAGEVQVVWHVPLDMRGYVIGKQGSTHQWIEEASGCRVHITDVTETVDVNGKPFVTMFLRGAPDRARHALTLIRDYSSGVLGEAGFEPVLHAVERYLRADSIDDTSDDGWRSIRQITDDPAVRAGLQRTKDLQFAAGLRTLLEILEHWPQTYEVQRTGPHGAAARLVTW